MAARKLDIGDITFTFEGRIVCPLMVQTKASPHGGGVFHQCNLDAGHDGPCDCAPTVPQATAATTAPAKGNKDAETTSD